MFRRLLDNWYPDEEKPADKSFWRARYKQLIGEIKCTALREATTGPAAVPRYAKELVQHKYDTRKMKIMKLALLVKFFSSSTVTGRIKKDRRDELVALWLGEGVWIVPSPQRSAVIEQANKHTAAGTDDSDDEEESDEEDDMDVDQQAADDDHPAEADALALIARKFTDSEDGREYVCFRVLYSPEFDEHLVYAYPSDSTSPTLDDCEYWGVSEVLDDGWADFEDGKDPRQSKWPPDAMGNGDPEPTPGFLLTPLSFYYCPKFSHVQLHF